MKSKTFPLSVKPANEQEEKALLRMMNQETPEFVPSHDPVVKWFDMIPLHYSVLQIAILKLLAFSLNCDVIVLGFIFFAVSLPLLLYAIHHSSSLQNSIFESRLVLPNKLSYTSVIVRKDLISSYRFWVKMTFSLVESYGIIILLSKFLVK